MRERASSIGATLEIVSAPGRGTRVRCTMTPSEVRSGDEPAVSGAPALSDLVPAAAAPLGTTAAADPAAPAPLTTPTPTPAAPNTVSRGGLFDLSSRTTPSTHPDPESGR